MKNSFAGLISILFTVLFFSAVVFSQTTEFTYQGRLLNASAPANGSYDFEFVLFDGLSAGTQIGPLLSRPNVAVADGIFSVKLDFGNNFPGANRYLEIRVRQTGQPGITVLSPRQLLNSSPYAVKSLSADVATNATNAATATNALSLGGVAANQYVQTGDARLADARNPLAGSGNYIQNQSAVAQNSSFNISGNGIVGGRIGIGTTNPSYKLHVDGGSGLAVYGNSTASYGVFGNSTSGTGVYGLSDSSAGVSGRSTSGNGVYGYSNSGFGVYGNSGSTGWAGYFSGNAYISGKVGIGSADPFYKLQVVDEGSAAGAVNGHSDNGVGVYGQSDAVDFATGVFGRGDSGRGVYGYSERGNGVEGVTVSGYAGYFDGKVRINTWGSAGATSLCRNASNEIATCSSSLRYKTDVQTFSGGLSIISRLRPIAFNWKTGGTSDIGLAAEEVERVEPLLTFRNQKGEIEGVKYDQLSAVLINAIKEQQAEIKAQAAQIKEQAEIIRKQRVDLDALKSLVCAQNPATAICKSR